LITLRPGDANEVLEAWKVIVKLQHEPVCLILTREDLPTLDRTKYKSAEGVSKGAYVFADAPGGKPEVLIFASGSTLYMAAGAYDQLTKEGIKARVISMPSWEMFEHYCAKKDPKYREEVIPSSVTARVAVEMSSTFGWHQYVGLNGAIL